MLFFAPLLQSRREKRKINRKRGRNARTEDGGNSMTEERKAAERLLFRFLCAVLALIAVIWLLPEVWDKLSPFIISIPVAAMLQPVIRFFQKRLKFKRSPAALLPVLLLLVIVLGVMIWLLTVGVTEISRIVNNSGGLVTESVTAVRTALNNLLNSIGASTDAAVEQWLRGAVNNIVERLTVWGGNAAEYLVTFSINLAAAMPYSIIYISFLTIGLYFISKNYAEIRSYLPGGARHRQDSRTAQLTHSTVKSLFGYLKVQGTFGVIVWVISWIYLAAFRYKYAGLVALFCGVMEMVPMIGSGVPYFILSALQFLLGNAATGWQLLFLTLGLQLLRRILEPKIMSDSIGISPLQSLVGMFVGMRLGGIAGLIAGPVLMSVFVGALKGGLFASTEKDIRLIADYLRNRWK